jgi:hypothetical protein
LVDLLMNSETVSRFFGFLLPNYVTEPVVVELMTRAKGCPHRAVVGWDAEAKSFRILIDEGLYPERLFVTLWHEAAHIRNGDAHRGKPIDWELERAMMWGAKTPAAEQLRAEVTQRARGGGRDEPKEVRADDWGLAMFKRWWPILSSSSDLESAMHGARWVLRIVGK